VSATCDSFSRPSEVGDHKPLNDFVVEFERLPLLKREHDLLKQS
jgi:hypothetical protein